MVTIWSRWWECEWELGSGWTLKEEPIRFAEETHVGGRERDGLRVIPRVLA